MNSWRNSDLAKFTSSEIAQSPLRLIKAVEKIRSKLEVNYMEGDEKMKLGKMEERATVCQM